MLRARTILAACALAASVSPLALALDDAHRAKADAMIDKAIDYLRSQQDQATGGWAVNPKGPNYPGITGLVVTGMLLDPAIDANDKSVQRGVEFMLRYRQADGGIYDQVLPSYNTSLCLSALALVQRENAAASIQPAQEFLKSLQWSEGANLTDGTPEAPTEITKDHPFYGGWGYGNHGRPDLSNTAFALQALHDSGLSSDDPAFQRALTGLARCQMVDGVNDMPYAEGSEQGGFIYATSLNKDNIGSGETKPEGVAQFVEESTDDGRRVSRMRAYGSMTYSGFKSLLFAQLDREDPRVQSAYEWIRRNYTLQENPQMGDEGLYYYFVSFARALESFGPEHITPLIPVGSTTIVVNDQTAAGEGSYTEGETRDWQNDLVARLAELQNPDGSFKSVNSRWMENNPVLITAYSLIALQNAVE
jgi:squalene-hopene/tetraprenyl-beta-curcumene cyclase